MDYLGSDSLTLVKKKKKDMKQKVREPTKAASKKPL